MENENYNQSELSGSVQPASGSNIESNKHNPLRSRVERIALSNIDDTLVNALKNFKHKYI